MNIKVAFLNIKRYNKCTLDFYHNMIEGENILDKKHFLKSIKLKKTLNSQDYPGIL